MLIKDLKLFHKCVNIKIWSFKWKCTNWCVFENRYFVYYFLGYLRIWNKTKKENKFRACFVVVKDTETLATSEDEELQLYKWVLCHISSALSSSHFSPLCFLVVSVAQNDSSSFLCALFTWVLLLATLRSATWSVYVNWSHFVSCTKWVIVPVLFSLPRVAFLERPFFLLNPGYSCILLEKAVPFSALCFSLLALDRDRGNTLNRQSGSVFFRE